jgi:hypothetical protein
MLTRCFAALVCVCVCSCALFAVMSGAPVPACLVGSVVSHRPACRQCRFHVGSCPAAVCTALVLSNLAIESALGIERAIARAALQRGLNDQLLFWLRRPAPQTGSGRGLAQLVTGQLGVRGFAHRPQTWWGGEDIEVLPWVREFCSQRASDKNRVTPQNISMVSTGILPCAVVSPLVTRLFVWRDLSPQWCWSVGLSVGASVGASFFCARQPIPHASGALLHQMQAGVRPGRVARMGPVAGRCRESSLDG